MKLISLLPINLREAEGDEEQAADDAGAEENPFAAGGEDTGGDEETPASDGEEAGEEAGQGAPQQKPIEVEFDIDRARKYNNVAFKSNTGVATGINKYGVTVQLPDGNSILVNFEDLM